MADLKGEAMSEYKVRLMTREDFDLAIHWAAEEGWNPGLADAGTYFETDPEGYWCGVLNGEMVASISAVKYGVDFGFVGFYIVKSGFRGKGYGLELWNRAMESLAGRNVGLDGVVEQQDNYKKSGFQLAYNNIRYEGVTNGESNLREGIVAIAEDQLEVILSYDKPFFPGERQSFLRKWLKQDGSTALASWRDGDLLGYGVIRPCRNGYKIGPLFADTAEIAESLLLGLQSSVRSGEPFYLDFPEGNEAALVLVMKYKMRKVFDTARMYTADFPTLPLSRIYGVTSFELG
mmetsp:Transcript_11611/g.13660  ORF Transcript_11611/g.13660 Transcript_11611/m.13660 type:complete len:290 (-) Transcript_11611:112-981(-)